MILCNVHIRRATQELYQSQLDNVSCILKTYPNRPCIVGGDFNSTLGNMASPWIGPFHGEQRDLSPTLSAFVLSNRLMVANSWQDVGPTRSPRHASMGVPSRIDWLMTRDLEFGECDVQHPDAWEDAFRVACVLGTLLTRDASGAPQPQPIA